MTATLLEPPSIAEMIRGIDVSNHQPDWMPGSEAFVFILCTDGHSWESPTHTRQVRLARAKRKVVGHYHWLRHGDILAQARWFVDHAKPRAGDVLVCDWEQSGVTNRDKDDFIRAVQALCPANRVVLYCNRNYWLNYDRTSFVGDALWIAVYGAADPGIQFDWRFWQYADHAGAVSIDQNHARFPSKSALQVWSRKGAEPSEPTPPATITTVTPVPPTLNAVHTTYGQWGSSWTWNKGKNPAHPTWGQHGGEDWHRGAGMAEVGDPIVAVADGEIIYAGDARQTDAGWGRAFGIHVLNKWADGGRTSIDAHMSKLAPGIRAGVKVRAGDVIGFKGMTGNVSGPHDHHEQHIGTRWTDRRVKPIYPGRKIAAPATPTPSPDNSAEELDVSKQFPEMKRTKPQTVQPTGKEGPAILKLEDSGNVTWGWGPGRYYVEAYIRFKGADANDELLVRAAYHDTPFGSGKVAHASYSRDVGQPGGDGKSFRLFTFRRNVGKPAKGRTRRLRLAVENYSGHDIIVTEVYVTVWKAPL